MLGVHELCCKGIQHVGDIWDGKNQTSISWDEAQTKFNLTSAGMDDWTLLITKSWAFGGTCWSMNLLSPIPNNGWDYTLKDMEDPDLVFQCSEFTPSYAI